MLQWSWLSEWIVLRPGDELVSATYSGSGAVMHAQNGRTIDGPDMELLFGK